MSMKMIVGCLMILGLSFWANGAEIVIRKSAGDANPSLAIAAFDGPADLREMLETCLVRCDWFAVTRDARAAAALQVRAMARRNEANNTILRVQLFRGTERVADIKQSLTGNDSLLVARVVDELIRRVFGVPGPCSRPIAFVMENNGRKELFSTYLSGGGMRQLTRNGSISTEPSWGRTSRSIFYTYYEPSRMSVMELDLAAGRHRRVAHFGGLNAGAALSPDGSRIALCLSRDNVVDLYTMAVSGKGLRRLTRGQAVESSPCWSPDGRRICYVSDVGGRPQLYVMASGGGESRRLTNDSAECVSPDWSRVSNSICMAVRREGRYVIGVIAMADSSRTIRIVTSGSGDWEAPSWAPDGRHIVCTRQVAGGLRELVMVDSVHGTVTKITRPAKVSLPAWAPR